MLLHVSARVGDCKRLESTSRVFTRTGRTGGLLRVWTDSVKLLAMRLNPETVDAIGVVVTALATILLVVATVLLAKATNRLNKISAELKAVQHSAALTQALNVQNSAILSSDENLMAADALITRAEGRHSIAEARERWICFMLLNVQALIFASRNQDQAFREIWEAAQRGVLDRLIQKETVMELLRERGYAQEFVKYCEARRKELLQSSGEATSP